MSARTLSARSSANTLVVLTVISGIVAIANAVLVVWTTAFGWELPSPTKTALVFAGWAGGAVFVASAIAVWRLPNINDEDPDEDEADPRPLRAVMWIVVAGLVFLLVGSAVTGALVILEKDSAQTAATVTQGLCALAASAFCLWPDSTGRHTRKEGVGSWIFGILFLVYAIASFGMALT